MAAHTAALLRAVLFAVLSGLLFGLEIGLEGGVIILDTFRRAFHLPLLREGEADDEETAEKLGWLISLFPLACATSALCFGGVSHTISRKTAIFIGALLFTLGGLVQALCLADKWWLMQIGRVISGAAVGVLSSITPVYIAELASPDIRGALNTTFQLFISLGVAVAFGINLLVSSSVFGSQNWRLALGSQSVFSLLVLLGINCLPESPRLLMQQRREQEARRVLKQLRSETPVDTPYCSYKTSNTCTDESKIDSNSTALCTESINPGEPFLYISPEIKVSGFWSPRPIKTSIDAEIEEIRAKLYAERKQGVISWLHMFDSPLRLRTLIGCCMGMAQQLSFVNAIIYYSATMFSLVNVNPLVATALVGLVNIFATFLSLKFVDSSGRVILLFYSAVGMSLAAGFITVIQLVVYFVHLEHEMLTGYLIVLCIFAHKIFFSVGFGPVPWLYPSEIFEMNSKGKGVAMSTTTNWLVNTAVGLLTPLMLTKLGVGTFFAIISLCNLVLIVFVLNCVPETRARSLESMPALFQANTLAELWAWTAQNRKNNVLLICSNGKIDDDSYCCLQAAGTNV